MYSDGNNENDWAVEYKKHSEKVFRYLQAKEYEKKGKSQPPLCTESSHCIIESGDKDNLCSSLEDQIDLMTYHMNNVQGYQPQKFMRGKVFDLLESDIKNLPKHKSKNLSDKNLVKYLHSVGVVLYNLVRQQHWIEWKIYGANDLDVMFDAIERVKVALKTLLEKNVFNSKAMYKTFVLFEDLVKKIDKWNDRIEYVFENEQVKKTRFFTKKQLKYYEDASKQLQTTFGNVAVYNSDEEEVEDTVPPVAVTTVAVTTVAETTVTSSSSSSKPEQEESKNNNKRANEGVENDNPNKAKKAKKDSKKKK
jgi:hypothetical protein